MSVKLDIIDGEKRKFEEDVEVDGSIIGSRVYVRGSLKAVQVLNSELFIQGDLEVRDVIQKSKVFCRRLFSGSGRLRRSDIYVERYMEAREIGTFPPTPISIYLGYRINLVREYLRIVREEKELLNKRERLVSSLSYLSVKVPLKTKEVEKLLIKSVKDKKDQRIIELLFELLLNCYEMEKIQTKKKTYIRMGVLVDEARLRVTGIIYPETVIYYGDEEHEILDKSEDVEIVVKKGVREK